MEVSGRENGTEGGVMSDTDMEVGMRPMIRFGCVDGLKRGWESVSVALERSALHLTL